MSSDDLERQLQRLVDPPLAAPEPIGALDRRVRGIRRARHPRQASGAFAAALAVVLIGVLVANVDSNTGRRLRSAAPTVTVGNADAIVQSTSFTTQGARGPLPATLAATLRQLDGVGAVEARSHGFAMVQHPCVVPTCAAVRQDQTRPTVAVSWDNGTDFALRNGKRPSIGEAAVNTVAAETYDLHVGDPVTLVFDTRPLSFTVSGVFELAGGDVTGVPLTAFDPTQAQDDLNGPDQLAIMAAPGVAADQLRARIGAALPAGVQVVAPSVLGSADQLRAELEIQHDFWTLTSPNVSVDDRASTIQDGDTIRPFLTESFSKFAADAANAELRVQRVEFTGTDQATVIYTIYFDGAAYSGTPPLPGAITAVLPSITGTVYRANSHWVISRDTYCALAQYGGVTCPPSAPQTNTTGTAPPTTSASAPTTTNTAAPPTTTNPPAPTHKLGPDPANPCPDLRCNVITSFPPGSSFAGQFDAPIAVILPQLLPQPEFTILQIPGKQAWAVWFGNDPAAGVFQKLTENHINEDAGFEVFAPPWPDPRPW